MTGQKKMPLVRAAFELRLTVILFQAPYSCIPGGLSRYAQTTTVQTFTINSRKTETR